MRVLVVAAHPDDEVLGCGGTIARLASEGHTIDVAILGEGITSRSAASMGADPGALERLKGDAVEAMSRLGVNSPRFFNLPDNRFDTVPTLDVIKAVEGLVDDVVPERIYTHHGGDLNIDHGVVHRAVLTATRPIKGHPVQEVLTFEIGSSTDWALQQFAPAFRPNVFVDIGKTLEKKQRAMEAYVTEARPFPHPRSPEAIEAYAKRWGATAGLDAAEAFELIRSIH